MTAVRIATRGLAVLVLAVAFALVHANVATAAPTNVTLSPPADVNQVGTPHTVTATVTGFCLSPFFITPCPGVLVNFTVFSGPVASPPNGVGVTNGAGQATFTFTNFNPGTNQIAAFVSGCCSSNVVTKTWIGAGPPRSVQLTPPSDTNPVGTPHTVTATVRDQSGNPTPGVLVQFTVMGGGTPTPPSGANVTNTAGQATFTFTNTTAGVTNNIRAFVPACPCNSNIVFKTWVAGPPRTLTLSPPADSNTVGTQHCVTATVRDQFGNPRSGVIVRFSVTGSVTTSGSATTNTSGMATFCYTGPPLPGGDAIHAYADFDNDNFQDPSPNEPFGDATKAWVLPPSTEFCEVRITQGGWITALNGDRASFGGNARVLEDDTVQGQQNYQDHGPADPRHVHSIELTAMTCSDDLTEGTIFGRATVDGAGDFPFRIDVTDEGEPGRNDTYGITMLDYASGQQQLQGGNVQIHRN